MSFISSHHIKVATLVACETVSSKRRRRRASRGVAESNGVEIDRMRRLRRRPLFDRSCQPYRSRLYLSVGANVLTTVPRVVVDEYPLGSIRVAVVAVFTRIASPSCLTVSPAGFSPLRQGRITVVNGPVPCTRRMCCRSSLSVMYAPHGVTAQLPINPCWGWALTTYTSQSTP